MPISSCPEYMVKIMKIKRLVSGSSGMPGGSDMKMRRIPTLYSKKHLRILFLGNLLCVVFCSCMKITVAHIGGRSPAADEFDSLTQGYIQRILAYTKCEAIAFRSEESFLEWLARQPGRTAAVPVLLDSRGRAMTSESF